MGPRAALLSLLLLPLFAGCGKISHAAGGDDEPLRKTWCHWAGTCLPPGKAPPLPVPAPSTFRPECAPGAIRCVSDDALPDGAFQACAPDEHGTFRWAEPLSTPADAVCEDGALVDLTAADFPCPPGETRDANGACAASAPQTIRLDVRTVRLFGRILLNGAAPTWTGPCDGEGPGVAIALRGERTGAAVALTAGCLGGFTFEARVPADRYTPTVMKEGAGLTRGIDLPVDTWTGPMIDARAGDQTVTLNISASAPRAIAHGDPWLQPPASTGGSAGAGTLVPVALRIEWNGAAFTTTAHCQDDRFATVTLRHELGATRTFELSCGTSTELAATLGLEPGHWRGSMVVEPHTAKQLQLGGPIDLGSIEVTGPGLLTFGFETTRVRAELLIDGIPPTVATACATWPSGAGRLRLRGEWTEAVFTLPCAQGPVVVEGLVERGVYEVSLESWGLAPANGWGSTVRIGDLDLR